MSKCQIVGNHMSWLNYCVPTWVQTNNYDQTKSASLGQKKKYLCQVTRPTPTKWRLTVSDWYTFFQILPNLGFHSNQVNSVTAANVFQMLGISICLIADFSKMVTAFLSVNLKNFPTLYRGHLQAQNI